MVSLTLNASSGLPETYVFDTLAKGLSVDDEAEAQDDANDSPAPEKPVAKSRPQTFSNSNVSTGAKPKAKRKGLADDVTSQDKKNKTSDGPKKKKPKKESKLLSFGDGED